MIVIIFAPFFLALQIHIVVNRIYVIHLFKKEMVHTQQVWDLLFIYKMFIFFFAARTVQSNLLLSC